MKTKLFPLILALGLSAATATAVDLTPTLKKEVRTGQNTALFAIKPSQSFPSSAMLVFLHEEKVHEKASNAFKLGFAMSVISHMTTAYEFSLSLPASELQHAGTGWVIYSSKATLLQIVLHLTDAQMVELFGEASVRKLRHRPGPL